ncbi:MAG: rhodanese-like domain-containing protein [Acidobacteriota bacterium]
MHTWIWIIVFVVFLSVLAIVRVAGQVPAEVAKKLLGEGAVIIDVRSPGEFGSGHLPKAINIPVEQVAAEVPRRVKDKERPLLLHCQSGMRSATAQRHLRALGYTRAFNLGSYARAAQIVGRR